jgi:hypothetical protein
MGVYSSKIILPPMLTEFALLKLQAINGEEQFVHSLPALIGSKRARDVRSCAQLDQPLEVLPISNIIDTFPYHALIYYQEGSYRLTAITPTILNSTQINPNKRLLQALANADRPVPQAVHEYLSAYLDPNYKCEE